VVTGSSPPARPCGLCRQALSEVATELPILCLNDAGERVETDLAALLPEPFRTEAGAPGRYGGPSRKPDR
jgi:cytidine deaminase